MAFIGCIVAFDIDLSGRDGKGMTLFVPDEVIDQNPVGEREDERYVADRGSQSQAREGQWVTRASEFPARGGEFPARVSQWQGRGGEFSARGDEFPARGGEFPARGSQWQARGEEFPARGGKFFSQKL